jgi:hypothetical protein
MMVRSNVSFELDMRFFVWVILLLINHYLAPTTGGSKPRNAQLDLGLKSGLTLSSNIDVVGI